MPFHFTQILPNKNAPKALKVGFELWEILTLLTVILSLASSVMWFSNLQPRKVESQFVFAELKKHIFYNQFQVLQNISAEPLEFSKPVLLSQTCYGEIANITIDTYQYDISLSKLASLEQDYSKESTQVKESLTDILNVSGFQSLLETYPAMLSELRENLQDRYALEQYKLRVLQGVSQLCLSPISQIGNFVTKVEIDLDSLNHPELESWKSTVRGFLTKTSSIADQLGTKVIEPEKIVEIGTSFVNIFSSVPTVSNLSTEELSSETSVVFEKIEAWQKSFLKENNKFVDRVVFIKE